MVERDTRVDEEIIDAMNLFCGYAPFVNSWIDVKKNLLLLLPPKKRSLFSRRDEKTKQQIPNAMEYELMQMWADLTGRPVIFTNDGQHGQIDPT